MRTEEIARDDRKTEDTDGEAEPATGHDVAEGGILGAVGGAVVGMVAGGPLGAVIGAVVGGVASASAVDVVDKYDHDFAHTADGSAIATPESEAVAAVTPIDFVAPGQFGAGTTGPTTAIRERAFEIYEQRGRGEGRDVEDWLKAEREVVPV